MDKEVPIKVDTGTAPLGIVRIHVAILDGETILSKTSMDVDRFNDGGLAEIYVEPGADREIIVWGENAAGLGEYMGSDIKDIVEGQKNVFEITMNEYSAEINFTYDGVTDVFSWNYISGATDYYIKVNPLTHVANIPEFHISDSNSFLNGSSYDTYTRQIRAYSDIFELSTSQL